MYLHSRAVILFDSLGEKGSRGLGPGGGLGGAAPGSGSRGEASGQIL